MPTESSIKSDQANQPICPYLSQMQPWNGLGTFRDYLVNHYALMAMNAGTIDHSRMMARQLENDFHGLGISISKRIKELKNG
jgi:hypothetical protein